MSIIYDVVINLIDYLIIFKYFNCFSKKRNLEKNIVLVFFGDVIY